MADAASAREGDPLDDLLERERAIVRIARLEDALCEALDGWHKVAEHWLHQYASEMCDEKLVEKSMLEVQDAGGTLSRIAGDNVRIAELRAQFLDDA